MKNVFLKVNKRKIKELDASACGIVFGATSGGGLDPTVAQAQARVANKNWAKP
ncbi:hypothetical protein [Pseudoalteromonas sp. Of7M-16]|uniref:hypothetical protein n=1 Tax=Pseudoalteromonas sp. Of7M-16 TaxID=2917756 RepID=UPI001EF4DEAC|nr:hypothetical protein [Pseudoalteromonas sp. Of7M-16]MCG7546973.1 hypothetical protein [Pseudoalteromonas sp. Of7M-16]